MTATMTTPVIHGRRRSFFGVRKSSWCFGAIRTCFLLWAVATPGVAFSEAIQASQIYVIDGDTIDIGGERVRLVGYDTPETYRARCDYERQLGNMASARLRELIDGVKQVDLALLPGRDKYGRLLGRLFVNRVDVGGTLIGDGLARRYEGGRRKGWCG